MGSLLEKFASKVDLIYIDPSFDTGSDFTFKVLVGNNDDPLPGKEPSLVEEHEYRIRSFGCRETEKVFNH